MIFRTTYFRLSSLLKQESQGLTNITLQLYFNEQNHTFPTLFTSNYTLFTANNSLVARSFSTQRSCNQREASPSTPYAIVLSQVPGSCHSLSRHCERVGEPLLFALELLRGTFRPYTHTVRTHTHARTFFSPEARIPD